MARMIIELTNRCNLRCAHCYDERHASTGDLPVTIVDKVLREGAECGIDHLCFTGGEPTLHRQFLEILARTSEAGFSFSFVSNGSRFQVVYRHLLTHRHAFRGVTFSLDGAREVTHDSLRGAGSYKQVMRAATLCFFHGLPFTFNMVLTAQNRNEIEEMVDTAARLGSRGVRFAHLMFSPATEANGLNLSPAERRELEDRIWTLRRSARVPVQIAPGYYSDAPFFPCAPLELEEYNLDHRGNLTLCCHLSGHPGTNEDDVLGNLHHLTLNEACRRFRERVDVYLADKRDRVRRGAFSDLDHFPCWYCVKYMRKVAADSPFPHSEPASVPAMPTRKKLPVNVAADAQACRS
jgi:MoaA/NifB/PqqE/SkfB family radical SAM enzyme